MHTSKTEPTYPDDSPIHGLLQEIDRRLQAHAACEQMWAERWKRSIDQSPGTWLEALARLLLREPSEGELAQLKLKRLSPKSFDRMEIACLAILRLESDNLGYDLAYTLARFLIHSLLEESRELGRDEDPERAVDTKVRGLFVEANNIVGWKVPRGHIYTARFETTVTANVEEYALLMAGDRTLARATHAFIDRVPDGHDGTHLLEVASRVAPSGGRTVKFRAIANEPFDVVLVSKKTGEETDGQEYERIKADFNR